MILLDMGPAVRAHVAIAVRAHCRQLKRDGVRPPPDLERLADMLLAPGDASSDQESPPLAAGRPGQAESEPRLGSVAAAARALGISPASVRRAVAAGHLDAVRVGRRVLIPADEIERLASGGQGGRQWQAPGTSG